MKNKPAEKKAEEKKTTEAYSSPDRISEYIRITNPGVWSLLIAFLAMVIAVVIWFVVGVIPSTMEIKGVLFPGDGTVTVRAPYDGRIQDMRVKTGDTVFLYEALALIPAQDKIDGISALAGSGDAEELNRALDDYMVEAVLRADQAGYVLNTKRTGDAVKKGDTVVTIAPIDDDTNMYQLICYVPADTARRLSAGMEVQACPSHLSREEYGYIYGYVESVGAYPVTDSEIEAEVGSKDYVQNIMGKGSMMQVEISLLADPEMQEGGVHNFAKWSNPAGNEIKLTLGMEFDIMVVLEQQKAYQMLLGI